MNSGDSAASALTAAVLHCRSPKVFMTGDPKAKEKVRRERPAVANSLKKLNWFDQVVACLLAALTYHSQWPQLWDSNEEGVGQGNLFSSPATL